MLPPQSPNDPGSDPPIRGPARTGVARRSDVVCSPHGHNLRNVGWVGQQLACISAWQPKLPLSLRFGFLVNSVHDNFPKLFDTLFFRLFFLSVVPFYAVLPENSPRKSKMSAEKAPLPFGYTFLAGEHIPSNPRAKPRSLAPLTMATKQAPLPVFLRRVAQLDPMLVN